MNKTNKKPKNNKWKEKLKLHFVEGTFGAFSLELADAFLSKEQIEFLKYVD